MIRYYILIVICCLSPFRSSGQEVWPGDVNNNGVVNGVDLLYWGQAFGSSGPTRATESTDWSGQPVLMLWAQNFPSGLNYAFADCNGDGEVDEEDYDNGIEENFALEHGPLFPDGYINAAPGTGPKLRMEASATIVEPGSMITIDLFLDNTTGPLNDFYGLALKMSYTTGILADNDGLDFDFTENSWADAGDEDAEGLFIDDNDNGTAELAFSRTNQVPVSVEAPAIGQFHVIVEDIIIGLGVDTFVIRIDSVLMVGIGLLPVPMVPDTLQILIVKDTSNYSQTTRTLTPEQWSKEIRIYPNPVSNSFQITAPYFIQRVILVDALGKHQELSMTGEAVLTQRAALPPGLSPGLYCLRILTSHGESCKKIIVSP